MPEVEAFSLRLHAIPVHGVQEEHYIVKRILENQGKDKVLSPGTILGIIHCPHVQRRNFRFQFPDMSNPCIPVHSYGTGGEVYYNGTSFPDLLHNLPKNLHSPGWLAIVFPTMDMHYRSPCLVCLQRFFTDFLRGIRYPFALVSIGGA